MEEYFTELIEEICQDLNINFEMLSNGFIFRLTKNGKEKYIYNRILDLNTAFSEHIVDDKVSTYEILKNSSVEMLEYKLLCNPKYSSNMPENYDIYKEANDFFDKYKNGIVVKPNCGTKGYGVFFCETKEDLIKNIDTLLEKYDQLCISPFYNFKYEYRTFMLNGEALYTYKKIKPFVVGNGRDTIRTLAERKDIRLLEEDLIDIDYDKVLSDGEKCEVCWKHNLDSGATVEDVDDKNLLNEIQKMCLEFSKKINLKFATIDIAQTEDGKLLLIEANKRVVTKLLIERHPNGKKIAKEIFTKAIIGMFKE